MLAVKITGIETLRIEHEDFCYLRVHTDEGISGLGETCFGPQAVEAYVHESVASRLIGQDPLDIPRHARDLPRFYIGHGGTGVSTRAHSAVDLALWDILGKVAGQPLFQLWGGRCRERIRIYNTCAGYKYGQAESRHRDRPDTARASGSGLRPAGTRGPYEDLEAFKHAAGELAASLLDQGITAMKIWPFDEVAHVNNGQHITAAELDRCLEPLRKIRTAVGRDIDVMIELHGLWQPLPAAQICRALEDYEPFWVEDAIKLNDLGALTHLKESTRLPFALGETVGNRYDLKRLLDTGAADVVMFDVGWAGGLSEARRLIALTEAYDRPIAPHDCTGPVVFTAGVHLAVSSPNALLQETVRAYYTDWYTKLVTELPTISGGFAAPPTGPGLGLELLPGFESRPDVRVRITTS
jgi:galactonate dehydratase